MNKFIEKSQNGCAKLEADMIISGNNLSVWSFPADIWLQFDLAQKFKYLDILLQSHFPLWFLLSFVFIEHFLFLVPSQA